MSEDLKDAGGFTLIEALVAMAVFAVGALMVVPTIFALSGSNTVSMQRDRAGSLLDSAAGTLAQKGWDTTEWSDTSATTSDFNNAVETQLDNPNYSSWASYTASEVPFQSAADVGYYTVEIVNDVGQPVARVMKVRLQWNGPNGNQLQETRIIQKNQ